MGILVRESFKFFLKQVLKAIDKLEEEDDKSR